MDNNNLTMSMAILAVLYLVLGALDMVKADAPPVVKIALGLVFAIIAGYGYMIAYAVPVTWQSFAQMCFTAVFPLGTVLGINYFTAKRIADQTRQTTLAEVEFRQMSMATSVKRF